MKILYEKVSDSHEDFLVARWNKDYIYTMPLHFHEEYEIICNIKSSGSRIVGDSKERFSEGDLVLIGSKLPHRWTNDELFTQNHPSSQVKAAIIQFDVSLVHMLDNRHEFKHITEMLRKATRGLAFSKEFYLQNKELILQLPEIVDPFEQIISVIRLLNNMAHSTQSRTLASLSYQDFDENSGINKILDTINFISSNYSSKILVDDVAGRLNMSTTAFCNFFKRKTGYTLIKYLNEIRISHAQRALLNSDQSISEIAFASGYNNISNFNRIFKSHTGKSPKEYRKIWEHKETMS